MENTRPTVTVIHLTVLAEQSEYRVLTLLRELLWSTTQIRVKSQQHQLLPEESK